MKDILSLDHASVLKDFARKRSCVVFDYDGTLAPIVPRPEDANLPETTKKILAELGRSYPIGILSGRSRADVMSRIEGLPISVVVGNHGLDWERDIPEADGYRKIVRDWKFKLQSALGELQGVEIEDKSLSLSVHYRRSHDKPKVFARIGEVLASLGAVDVLGGKEVINCLPPGSPHKGGALKRIRSELGCEATLYVGDDVTDEDAFAADTLPHLVAIRVERSDNTKAPFFISEQTQIDRLMQQLLELRRP